MKTLPSTEFRKTFHKLTEPTLVQVLGHVIGVWNPIAHVRAGLGHPGDESYALAKVVDQEEEIKRLKRELAKRPDTGILVPETLGPDVRTTGEPILPATKRITPSSAWTDEDAQQARRDRQGVVDAALAKVNRTGKKP